MVTVDFNREREQAFQKERQRRIQVRREVEASGMCPICGSEVHKLAYLDVDEWHLGWECEGDNGCLEEIEIPWPFGDRLMTVEQMEAEGYEVAW